MRSIYTWRDCSATIEAVISEEPVTGGTSRKTVFEREAVGEEGGVGSWDLKQTEEEQITQATLNHAKGPTVRLKKSKSTLIFWRTLLDFHRLNSYIRVCYYSLRAVCVVTS